MKRFIIIASAVAMPAFAADSYTFDPNHTRPSFLVSHMGFSTQHGRFGRVTGRFMLDRTAKKGNVELIIDANSIDMGTEKWNKHMVSEEFFNTSKFPTMVFKSDKLTFDADKVVAADGQFTLLGVTRPLTVNVANFRCAPHPMLKKDACGGDVSATIKRSDFGMTKFISMVGDEVKLIVPVEALKD